jgi:hypothetical protein
MKRSLSRRLGVLPLALLMVAAIVGGVGVGAAAATTYNGPDFATSPSTITAGGDTNIVLADAQTSTWNYGGGEITSCGTACSFTLEGCPTGVFTYYLVYQIRVVSPGGAEYALGSGNPGGTYDLTYPESVGGPSSGGVSTRTTAQGFGPALNITASDVLNVPFGPGTGVPFTLTTSIGTGTYAWFPVTGTSASTSPTSEVGTYTVDLEGQVLCGANHYEFDIGGLVFTTTSSTATPSVSTSLSASSIVQGGSVTDTATITGGNNPTGTITFDVYSGSTSSSCTGTPAYTQTVTLPTASATFGSGLAAGPYEVQATYSGDANNAGPVSSPCGSEPLTVTSGACSVGTTIASNFNGGTIVSGNYIWFNAHISLASPTPSNGLTIRFTGQDITFTANHVSYDLAVPDGEIVFSSSVTSASTTFTASGTWVTTVPVTQTGNIFISALMFVPATTLPGGINPVTWSGTFSSSSSQPLNLQWQWGAAVYTQPSGQPSFTGIPTSDVAAYNSLNVKPVDNGPFTTPLFPTPHTNGDHAGAPQNPAWKGAVTGGARGGGGSNWTGSWSATGQAKCS